MLPIRNVRTWLSMLSYEKLCLVDPGEGPQLPNELKVIKKGQNLNQAFSYITLYLYLDQ
jgi:hypothetical protein